MSHSYAKPENALRKAVDLVRVGKPAAAMITLRATITPKRHRTWHQTHEQIMMMYIGLAVNARRNIKDMLIQYRSICQSGQHASLQRVMAKYVEEVTKKTREVQGELNTANGGDVKILLKDLEESPRSIIAALECKEVKREERKGRAQLTLWVKYQWETCRTILDVLRNNDNCQAFYHRVAVQTFNFCQEYRRTTEFRRLCEILRNHIVTIGKHQGQNNAVNLNAIETQEHYLKTRFHQLNIAADLELWQEAYRTIEDIHTSMLLAPSAPPAHLMCTYYDKLAQIFWASSNHLFHAYCLNKYYELGLASNAAWSAEQRQDLANAVVVATLVIPVSNGDSQDYFDPDNESNLRLADLLGFTREIPTRQRLIRNIQNTVLPIASDNIRAAAALLESGFSPLALNRKLTPVLESLGETKRLHIYVDALRNTATLILLNQLSTVYKIMKSEKFMRIIPTGLTMTALEKLVIESNAQGLTQIRFDHRKQLIHFSDEDLTFGKAPSQLAVLGRQLAEIVEKVVPINEIKKRQEREMVFSLVAEGMPEEHKAVFNRMKMIEQRKQFNEKHAQEEHQQAEAKKAEEEAVRAAEERKRLQQESRRREEDRKRKIEAANRKRELETLAKRLEADVEGKGAARKTNKEITQALSNLENVKTEELIALQQKVEEDARSRLEEAHRKQAQHLNYLTRALRIEEKDMIIQHAQEQMDLDQESFEKEYEAEVKRSKARHDKALEDRKRIGRMRKHVTSFREKTDTRRRQVHDKQMAEWKARKDQWEQAMLERAEADRLDRIARQEEQDRLHKEREVQRKEAERRAKERADAKARREAEEAERIERLKAIEEKQRAREREIAERDAQKAKERAAQDAGRKAYRPPSSRDTGSRDTGGSSGWRRAGGDDGPSNNNPWQTSGGRRDSRFGRDRDSGRDGRFGRNDRDSGDRFGRNDRDSGDRFGRNDRNNDRDSGDRFGRNDRDSGDRFGRNDRNNDRDSGDRFGRNDRDSGDRFGRNDRDSRFGGGRDRDSRFGGGRDGPRDRPRDSRFGGGRDRDSRFGGRDDGPRRDDRFGGRDRDSGTSRDGAYRPPARQQSNRDGGASSWRTARSDPAPSDNNRDNNRRPSKYVPPSRRGQSEQPAADADGFTQVQGRRR